MGHHGRVSEDKHWPESLSASARRALEARGWGGLADLAGATMVEVVEAQVIATVQRIRRAEFVVQPRRDDCTSHCDYKAVCRIAQTRSAGKSREGPPGQAAS